MGRQSHVRFAVRVRSGSNVTQGAPMIIGRTGKLSTAYTLMAGVLTQWAASEGAVTPGTRMSIVDTYDGGEVLVVEYLGFEVNTLTGR